MRRFWNWLDPEPTVNPDTARVRVLRINGEIAAETWFDDDVTPQIFASELNAGTGDVLVWLNSPGGDVVAAAQIYNMLLDYPGKVTVNIDGVAASAASVIAMAADTVAMSPVSMLMIHNPATLAVGDKDELAKAMSMLDAVKDSIINAYQHKTGMSRAKLAKMMDEETWMDARAAISMGFADTLLLGNRDPALTPDDDPDDDPLEPDENNEDDEEDAESKPRKPSAPGKNTMPALVVFSRHKAEHQLLTQLTTATPTEQPAEPRGRRVVDLYAHLTNLPH